MQRNDVPRLPTRADHAAGRCIRSCNQTRLDVVQRRRAQVMPFDLKQTTHVFTKTRNSGLQQVISRRSDDIEQIELIRASLRRMICGVNLTRLISRSTTITPR